MKKNVPIGQLLLGKGYITEAQLQRALEMQKKTPGKRLGDLLVELSYVSELTMLECLSERTGAPLIDIRGYAVDEKAVALVGGGYARKHRIIPIDFQNNALVVATREPLDFYVFDELRVMTGYEISIVLALQADIDYMIEKYYSQAAVNRVVEDVNREYGEQMEDEALSMMGDRVEGTPVVKLVNTIISQAYIRGASDIHIEPFEKNLVIRIRVNGDLIHYSTMNMSAHNSILTRLKLLGGMNIAEKRLPQDGKFAFSTPEFESDIRLSTMPTIYGEKAVLRLLGGSRQMELLDLTRIGMDEAHLQQYLEMLKSPNGVILVSGPTGSGKTTTLYATLNKLVQNRVNIITVEDPVEKKIAGVNQVQVNQKAGLTFAASLRSILRQDPDIIMVGEMRDGETASIGVRAAITGHLVLSTIHTNDAISSITRLIDMGVAPYMAAASITGVVAQRLVKTLCPHCKEEREMTKREMLLAGEEGPARVFEPGGCERCNYTGYVSRKPVYELVTVDSTLREMISRNAPVHEMRAYEREKGNLFLRDSALAMVKRGETSVEEMERIVYSIE